MTPQSSDRRQAVCCRHCGKLRTGNRPRGLCWTCYYTPSVRDLYPSAYRRGRVEMGEASGEDSQMPPQGSDAKIALMEERVARGLPLHHPRERDIPHRRVMRDSLRPHSDPDQN